MRLTLAYSPCPNDTFAFHAMVNNLVDTEGLEFDLKLDDVQALNDGALRGDYDICKMSYHAYFHLRDKYRMLNVGSALGDGNGPLLVRKTGRDISNKDSKSVALPGKWTTAALLYEIFFKNSSASGDRHYCLFSDIAELVQREQMDQGVLIHEGRFVYQEQGLDLVADLGLLWQQQTGCLLPLGGIAVKSDMDLELANKIERVLRRSIVMAVENPSLSKEYIGKNAQELSEQVQQEHIKLFVNEQTLGIDARGQKAIEELYNYFKATI